MKFDKKFYSVLFTIGLPIVIQSLVTSLLNIIDTFMISEVSKAAIAGVGAANKVYFLLHLFLFGTISGAAILASQYWGIHDVKNIRRVLGLTLTIGISGAVIFTAGAIFFPRFLMRIFTPEVQIIAEGVKYLRIVGIGYIATAITFAYGFILRTTHHIKIPVLISVFFIGVNTFLNWVLIYGNLGMTARGVEGAAIATVIARTGEVITLLVFVYALKMPAAAKLQELFDWSTVFIRKYFKTVAPVMANEMLWASGVTGYALIYGRMGEVVMASMTISQTIEQLAFILFFGMSSACSVMLGNAMGANKMDRALRYAQRFVKMFIIIGIIIAVVLYFTSGYIADLYNIEPVVKETVKSALRVFCLFIPFKVINLLIIVGILRSGGDTIVAMVIDIGAVWLVGLPLGIIGGLVLGLDIKYVYAMILAEEAVKAIAGLIRLKSRKWMRNLVSEPELELMELEVM